MTEKPTRGKSILAHCHQCMGYWADGRVDCQNVRCPLYPWMPYREMEPDLEWLKLNPKRTGKVLKEDCKKELTDEERQVMAKKFNKWLGRGENDNDSD